MSSCCGREDKEDLPEGENTLRIGASISKLDWEEEDEEDEDLVLRKTEEEEEEEAEESKKGLSLSKRVKEMWKAL
jgi:hypothetical protein